MPSVEMLAQIDAQQKTIKTQLDRIKFLDGQLQVAADKWSEAITKVRDLENIISKSRSILGRTSPVDLCESGRKASSILREVVIEVEGGA